MQHSTDITSYVLGVAAKSNVEKRQVGCVITGPDGSIVAEGFNDDKEHAEIIALRNLTKHGIMPDSLINKCTVHVTHPPCPDCAKAIKNLGIDKVNVVNAFLKFDGDKTRFDLVDTNFAFYMLDANYDYELSLEDIKRQLLMLNSNSGSIMVTAANCAGLYDNFYVLESALAKVLTFGARKYKPNNWKQCSDTGRYLAAAHRHLNAAITGEDNDPETNLPHIDHFLCNIMFLYVLND